MAMNASVPPSPVGNEIGLTYPYGSINVMGPVNVPPIIHAPRLRAASEVGFTVVAVLADMTHPKVDRSSENFTTKADCVQVYKLRDASRFPSLSYMASVPVYVPDANTFPVPSTAICDRAVPVSVLDMYAAARGLPFPEYFTM